MPPARARAWWEELLGVPVDGLRRSGEWNSALAPVSLMEAFPGLRAEEARAVCNDWRAAYHERRAHPAARPV